MKFWLAGLLFAAGAAAQPPDPAYQPLSKAFESLRAHDYDIAIAYFQRAAALSPQRTDIRKNLAYTLLKTGGSDAAREQFGEAMRLDPSDLHVALEYAFLCYEAREDAPARKAEARRIFAHVRDVATDETIRATASQAFANIDTPLRDTIERWQRVLAKSKPAFSALYELAQAAEARDQLDIAAASYRAAFQLLPARKSVLLELARAEKSRDNEAGAMAAWLAASRGPEPRSAELARERMPARYPYVYEFRDALKLDPGSHSLHRELAYLLLSMSEKNPSVREEAEHEFQSLSTEDPGDYLAAAQLGLLYLADHRDEDAMPLLRNVIAHADPATANRARMALHMPLVLEERNSSEAPLDPRLLADRSYKAGFLKDALRYYTLAREANPFDPYLALRLGWTNNLLHDDRTALRWFGIARQSTDSSISGEADRAWHNLSPSFERFRFTAWMYPVYSSRWSDLFGYGQAKEEIRIGKLPFRPYASVRLVGDARRYASGVISQSLSESAIIVAAGIATNPWRGLMAWGEAGEAISYVGGGRWRDYRGGVNFARIAGKSLAAEHSGAFVETTADAVFVSHFNSDLINYSQSKFGYTRVLGDLRAQSFWSVNVTFDAQRQYWANFAEFGPGVRFHFPGTPPAMSLTIAAVRGIYLVNDGNPRRPNYNDIRAGLWYAFTK
ncbi:MAG: tetratricopeptide repeat protein [Acidobacteriota bacterium]|nr:tetratricopeptide repeat protein [Acidobacteriota bacterium]